MRSTNSAKQVRFVNSRACVILSTIVWAVAVYAGVYYGLR
jgi:hypothetical protein